MRYTEVQVHFTNGDSKTINNVRQIASTDEMYRFEHCYTNGKWEFTKTHVLYIQKET